MRQLRMRAMGRVVGAPPADDSASFVRQGDKEGEWL